MLKEVLREVKEVKVYSKPLIAHNLKISEEVLEDMLSQLIRMGYLSEDLGSPTCESKCAGCHVSSCSITPIKMLSVTKKGENLLIHNSQ